MSRKSKVPNVEKVYEFDKPNNRFLIRRKGGGLHWEPRDAVVARGRDVDIEVVNRFFESLDASELGDDGDSDSGDVKDGEEHVIHLHGLSEEQLLNVDQLRALAKHRGILPTTAKLNKEELRELIEAHDEEWKSANLEKQQQNEAADGKPGYENMRVRELRALAKRRNLFQGGQYVYRQDLVAMLKEADAAAENDDAMEIEDRPVEEAGGDGDDDDDANDDDEQEQVDIERMTVSELEKLPVGEIRKLTNERGLTPKTTVYIKKAQLIDSLIASNHKQVDAGKEQKQEGSKKRKRSERRTQKKTKKTKKKKAPVEESKFKDEDYDAMTASQLKRLATAEGFKSNVFAASKKTLIAFLRNKQKADEEEEEEEEDEEKAHKSRPKKKAKKKTTTKKSAPKKKVKSRAVPMEDVGELHRATMAKRQPEVPSFHIAHYDKRGHVHVNVWQPKKDPWK